jgi:hypothetical protein
MNLSAVLIRKLEDIDPKMIGYHYTPEVEAYASRLYPNILRYKTFQITAMA